MDMKKDLLCFAAGLTTGLILGLMVRDQDKKMVQDTLANQVNYLRRKYEELSKEGKELLRDGMDKAMDKAKDATKDFKDNIKKEYLS